MRFFDTKAQRIIHQANYYRIDHTDRLIDLLIDSGEFQWPNTTKQDELVNFYCSGDPESWIEDDTMELIQSRGIDLGQVDFRRVAVVAFKLAIAMDETLMEGLKAGDQSALEVLVERHRDRLLAFAVQSLGGDQPAAEAVVDRVFAKVEKYAHMFRPGCAFFPWLYTICDRVLNSHKQRAA